VRARRLERLLPPLGTLTGYSKGDLRRDAGAGVAVWAAAVPSGLAYAGLAGLPPIVGLYASAVAGLAYGLAGSIRQAQVGPTSTSSILTAAAIAPMAHGDVARATELAAMLALEVAAVMLIAWVLHLGFLADLLSRPVLVGFTAAMSLVIIAAQLPNLLGVSGVTTRTFQTTLGGLGGRLDRIDADAVAIGVGALVALLVLRRRRPRWPRELIVVGAATLLVGVLGLQDAVHVVGDVPSGLPAPELPSVAYEDFERLVPAAAGIALIAFVETIAIGRTFATLHRYEVEPRNEFLALGVANLASGVFQGYAANASFAQTALADGAGGRTVIAGVTTKVAILATLLVLTPLFANVPYPVLAGVVIAAVLSFIDVPEFRRLLRFQRAAQRSKGRPAGIVPRQPEFWSAVATFAGTLLFGILNGILVGVLATLLAVLHRLSRPRVAVLGKVAGGKRHRDIHRHPEAKTREGVLIVRFEAPIFFGNAHYFHQSVLGLVDEYKASLHALVLVCDGVSDIDLTGLDALRDLTLTVQRAGIELRMCRVKGPVHDAVLESGLVDLIGAPHFYDSVRAAKKGRAPDGLPVVPEAGTT
jgi:sulfate permease, SulP family